MNEWMEEWKNGRMDGWMGLPGRGPVMTGAIQQRAHVRLPPPGDIYDQNACANRDKTPQD